jgi:hypothetical protein
MGHGETGLRRSMTELRDFPPDVRGVIHLLATVRARLLDEGGEPAMNARKTELSEGVDAD